jgi:hypothetical protein
MIGHPLEKLFVEIPLSGKMDLKLGRNTVTIPITQTKNSVTEPLPHSWKSCQLHLLSPLSCL